MEGDRLGSTFFVFVDFDGRRENKDRIHGNWKISKAAQDFGCIVGDERIGFNLNKNHIDYTNYSKYSFLNEFLFYKLIKFYDIRAVKRSITIRTHLQQPSTKFRTYT